MIKIIHILFSSNIGGGEKITFEIINRLKNKFNFKIIAPLGVFFEKYLQLGIESQLLKRGNIFRIINKIRNFIKKVNPEIVHCQGTRAALWTKLAIIGLKKRPKMIYTLHGFHIIRRSFFSKWPLVFLERFLNYLTDVLVCTSESDKNLVLKYKTISPEKIKIIKNGIEIKKNQKDPREIEKIKKEMQLENNFVISSIARLRPPKDFSTILRALKLIICQIPNSRLLIVGDGPLRKSLEKETEKLRLSPYVKFLSFRKDIATLINLSDLVILSTKWEGLPLVPLEVGIAKKPIIASNVDGMREVVLDKKTGYLFIPGFEKDLADKILKLYFSKDLREKMGEEAYYFVLENFNNERMLKEYQNLYQSL